MLTEHLHSSAVLNEPQVSVFFPLKIATYEPVIHSRNSKSCAKTKPRRRQGKSCHGAVRGAEEVTQGSACPRCSYLRSTVSPGIAPTFYHSQRELISISHFPHSRRTAIPSAKQSCFKPVEGIGIHRD